MWMKYFTKHQWDKVKHMYEGCHITKLMIGVIVSEKRNKRGGAALSCLCGGDTSFKDRHSN
jgi:hypothetical protein